MESSWSPDKQTAALSYRSMDWRTAPSWRVTQACSVRGWGSRLDRPAEKWRRQLSPIIPREPTAHWGSRQVTMVITSYHSNMCQTHTLSTPVLRCADYMSSERRTTHYHLTPTLPTEHAQSILGLESSGRVFRRQAYSNLQLRSYKLAYIKQTYPSE